MGTTAIKRRAVQAVISPSKDAAARPDRVALLALASVSLSSKDSVSELIASVICRTMLPRQRGSLPQDNERTKTNSCTCQRNRTRDGIRVGKSASYWWSASERRRKRCLLFRYVQLIHRLFIGTIYVLVLVKSIGNFHVVQSWHDERVFLDDNMCLCLLYCSCLHKHTRVGVVPVLLGGAGLPRPTVPTEGSSLHQTQCNWQPG